MSSTNRKFVIAYIILVGIPLAAMALVLRNGRNLVAPISIDGTWKIEAGAGSPSTGSCAGAISSILNSPLVISQSGTTMVISTGKTRSASSGTLTGTDLKASITPSDDSPAGTSAVCGANQQVLLTAVVEPKSEPRSLSGSLVASDCASCEPIHFYATRQPKAPIGAAH